MNAVEESASICVYLRLMLRKGTNMDRRRFLQSLAATAALTENLRGTDRQPSARSDPPTNLEGHTQICEFKLNSGRNDTVIIATGSDKIFEVVGR